MKTRVRTSVIVVWQGRLLSFRAEDPSSGKEYFFLPGGQIEEDETAPEAAERETFEETGYRVVVDPKSNIDREYVFNWDGEDFDCITIFYLATLTSPMQSPVQDADYNKGTAWIPVSEVNSVFNYKEEILSAIQELLEKSATHSV